jgi:hypothetical protein
LIEVSVTGELRSGTEKAVHGFRIQVTVPGGDAYGNAECSRTILPNSAEHLLDNPVDGESAAARKGTLAKRTKAAVCALG